MEVTKRDALVAIEVLFEDLTDEAEQPERIEHARRTLKNLLKKDTVLANNGSQKWVVAPTFDEAREWVQVLKRLNPLSEYHTISRPVHTQGARMRREDVIFINREAIHPDLLTAVEQNLTFMDGKEN